MDNMINNYNCSYINVIFSVCALNLNATEENNYNEYHEFHQYLFCF